MKQKIIPIISIIVGILAFCLTALFLNAQREKVEKAKRELLAGAKQINVVVAANDISAGVAIRKEDLISVAFIESAVPDDVVQAEDWEKLKGKKLLKPIGKGRPISWFFIEGSELFNETSLAAIVSKGMRAISLPINGSAAVSGMVQPNDRVDILGTFSFPSKKVANEMENVTITVLQDVTILATGQNMAKQPSLRRKQMGSSSTFNAVTIEVTPREAELLVFAQQMKGSLTLSLRNSADNSFEKNLPEVNFQHVETSLPELNLHRQKEIRHKTNL